MLLEHGHLPEGLARFWKTSEGASFATLEELLQGTLQRTPLSSSDRDRLGILLERLWEEDRDRVVVLLAGMGGEALGELLPILAGLDATAAADLYRSLSGTICNALLPHRFLTALGRVDSGLALEIVSELDFPRQAAAMGSALSGLAEKEAEVALRIVEALNDDRLAEILGMGELLRLLGAQNPERVAVLMERLPMTGEVAKQYAQLAGVWAKQDPTRALAWVKALEFEAVRSSAMTALYRSWVAEDQTQAFAKLQEIPDEGFRFKVFAAMTGDLMDEVFRQDLPGAEGWADSLEGRERAYALAALGRQVASGDPVLAARFLERALEGPRAPVEGPAVSIATAYATQDPEAASRWAEQFRDREWIYEKVVLGVAESWSGSDPQATQEWIETLSNGEARNSAIYMLVGTVRDADPAGAFAWASEITNDRQKRRYLLKQATTSWAAHAPAEARVAIAGLDIPAADVQSLERLVDELERNR